MRLMVKAATAAAARPLLTVPLLTVPLLTVPLLTAACSATSGSATSASTTSGSSTPASSAAAVSSASSASAPAAAGDPLASLTAAQIASKADANLKSASSVHFTGKITVSGSSETYDLTVAPGKCSGSIVISSGGFEVIQIGNTVWLRSDGTADYLKTTAGNQQYQGLTGYCSLAALSTVFDLPGVVRGGTSEMGGQKVLELKVPDTSMKAYVTDSATPEYVKADLVDTQLEFSGYGAPVSISPPPASEVFSS